MYSASVAFLRVRRINIKKNKNRKEETADSLDTTGVEGLPKQVKILREFEIWPVSINFGTF